MDISSVSEKLPSSSEEQRSKESSPTEESTEKEQIDKTSISENDPNVVVFDGPSDSENPHNWPNSRKYVLVGLLSSMLTMV
jgi:hypothetical protein